MHQVSLATHLTAIDIGGDNGHDESQEHEQVDVGEHINELRDGVVGRNCLQHIVLVNPTESLLVARHFHPYRVDGVYGNGRDVGYHDMVVSVNHQRVDGHLVDSLYRQLYDKGDGVDTHLEVVVLGVVVRGIEGDAVQLPLRQVPGVRRQLPTIVT